MHRRVVILASGTRGDVQPLVALGRGLQRAGHTVRFVTHPAFQRFVARYGLAFTPLDGDPNVLLNTPGGPAALTYDGQPLRSLLATLRYLRAVQPLFARMLWSAWQASQQADALVVSLPTLWGRQIAEALSVLCICAWTQPVGRTRTFPSPLQPFARSFGPAWNRLSHAAVAQSLWLPWRAAVNRWREVLSRTPAPLLAPPNAPDDLLLYGFSARVVPKPADWPPGAHVTGYWFLDRPDDWTPPEALVRFLDSPPVYIGFGSLMRRPSATLVNTLSSALRHTGLRAIIVGSAPAGLPPNCFFLDDAPHDWLFPRVAAVVHHGGAGTTAAALRAGVPQCITPIGVDNFFWGRRVAELHVGPAPLPLRRLTADRLAEALHQATRDVIIRTNAAALGEHIRAERGVAQAVALMESRM